MPDFIKNMPREWKQHRNALHAPKSIVPRPVKCCNTFFSHVSPSEYAWGSYRDFSAIQTSFQVVRWLKKKRNLILFCFLSNNDVLVVLRHFQESMYSGVQKSEFTLKIWGSYLNLNLEKKQRDLGFWKYKTKKCNVIKLN